MEVWIFIAAAGSGYLTRRWQNSQKPKGVVADETEDDSNTGTSNYPASSRGRGRYRRFSSSGKRQVGKSVCGKGSPLWMKQLTRGGGNINRMASGDDGNKIYSEGHICDDGDCQICVSTRETSADPTSIKIYPEEEENFSDYLSRMRLSNCHEMRAQGVDEDKLELERNSPVEAIKGGNLLSRPVSGKRASESLDDKTLKTRQISQDGYVGKRIKDAFQTISEGVFVLDTESLHLESIKHGRGKPTRKKNLTSQKPMSSLETCLSAQLNEDYTRRAASKAEFAIGLPSLLRQSSSKKLPSSRISSTFTAVGDANNPFAGPGCRKLTRSMAGMDERTSYTKGKAGSSLDGLLFNFGVGVGMMFTVMSNMREVRWLTSLLKEAELLIRDLEDELEAKEGVVSDSDVFVKRSAEMHASLEQRRNHSANTLRKVKSATKSLSSMRASLPNGSLEAGKPMHSKDMSKLEAELEAELERMELSLGEGDLQKSHVKSSGSSELDGEVGSLVQGELTILGLPHEVEMESDDDDGSSSSQGDLHVRNYAMSPRALAKRLHEVLEARQEQHITELEAELMRLKSKLQAREEEISMLKERPMGVSPGNVEERVHNSSFNYPQNKDTSALDGFSKVEWQGSGPQMPHLLNESPASPPPILPWYAPSTGLKDFSRKGLEDKSTAYITLGGEAWAAYKEACDEFSKLSGDLCRKTEREDGFAKHVGNSDGLEQVDLLSLAQDFYGDGDPEFFANMPAYSNVLRKGRHYPRRKSRKGVHPEPEQAILSSRGFDSSDDATNDTSVSTPCSVKFMDVQMVGSSEGAREGKEEEGYFISIPPYDDWNQEVLVSAGLNTPNQEDLHFIHPVVENSSSRFMVPPPIHGGDWAASDDSDDYSELDEQLGQLLIKRIVEKSRKGSAIVQDAHTMLASLEKSDRLEAVDQVDDGKW